MGKKKIKDYNPEALEYFKKCMELVRNPGNANKEFSKLRINHEGLKNALYALPKIDRERIEKFWGLTGGPNHSKKLTRRDPKDVAYNEMVNLAILSLRKIFTLDYLMMYDSIVSTLIEMVNQKINKDGLDISDAETTKLLMAFFVYVDNGPKMSFEEDPMSFDTQLNGAFLFDEYEVLNQMCQELESYPDKSINLRLLISLFETIDFKDKLSIKKSMGIEIDNYFKNLQVITMGVGIENIKDFTPGDVEITRSASKIRELKERAFPYGAWKVTSALILGNPGGEIKFDEFFEKLCIIRKDWSKIENFKTGNTQLRISNETRTLNVYNIGGLEFTDIGEVMFLYTEGNLITSTN